MKNVAKLSETAPVYVQASRLSMAASGIFLILLTIFRPIWLCILLMLDDKKVYPLAGIFDVWYIRFRKKLPDPEDEVRRTT
jgi:hypothetical protein